VNLFPTLEADVPGSHLGVVGPLPINDNSIRGGLCASFLGGLCT